MIDSISNELRVLETTTTNLRKIDLNNWRKGIRTNKLTSFTQELLAVESIENNNFVAGKLPMTLTTAKTLMDTFMYLAKFDWFESFQLQLEGENMMLYFRLNEDKLTDEFRELLNERHGTSLATNIEYEEEINDDFDPAQALVGRIKVR